MEGKGEEEASLPPPAKLASTCRDLSKAGLTSHHLPPCERSRISLDSLSSFFKDKLSSVLLGLEVPVTDVTPKSCDPLDVRSIVESGSSAQWTDGNDDDG